MRRPKTYQRKKKTRKAGDSTFIGTSKPNLRPASEIC